MPVYDPTASFDSVSGKLIADNDLDFLVANGVQENQIIAKGYGSLPNKEGGDGTENRRADVKIIAVKKSTKS